MGGLFSWSVSENEKDSSRNIIQIDQGGLVLPSRENYMNKTDEHDKILKAYLDYMSKVTVLLGAQDGELARKQMQEIIDFETRLAEITIPEDERRDAEKLYNLMNVTTLQNLAPYINWREFLGDAFKYVNRTITDNEEVVVGSPDFIKNLTKIINEYTQNDTGKM
jgi:membrane metallo-endopeptidase-like protein 1